MKEKPKEFINETAEHEIQSQLSLWLDETKSKRALLSYTIRNCIKDLSDRESLGLNLLLDDIEEELAYLEKEQAKLGGHTYVTNSYTH